MVSGPDWERVRCVDWLAHQWELEVRARPLGPATHFNVLANGVSVGFAATRTEAERIAATLKPRCLAELIASSPFLHPATAVIEGGRHGRLGRIKPELWGGYDALEVSRTADCLTLLSAKARAAFPREVAVFVRVYRATVAGPAPRRSSPVR